MKMRSLAFFLTFILTSTLSFSQHIKEVLPENEAGLSVKSDKTSEVKKDGTVEIIWSEDFSNGLTGQGDNGEWTTEGEQGELWFQTFPVGAENGYDPEAPIPGYGESLPNYFGEWQDIVSSPTRDNGIVMLDADRYNSTSTNPDDDPLANTTDNSVSAFLISPTINLMGIQHAELCFFTQLYMCCEIPRETFVDISFDNGLSWQVIDTVWAGNSLINLEFCTDISSFLLESPDNSNCKLRFRWPEGFTHFHWMLDDIRIQASPEYDLVAGSTWCNNYYELEASFDAGELDAVSYYDSFDMWQTTDYLARPMNFGMEVTNAGSQPQTNVKLVVTATSPSGNVETFQSEDGVTLEATVTDTLTIDNVSFLDIVAGLEYEYGQYTYDFEVIQDEVEEFPNDNYGASKANNLNNPEDNDGFGIYWNGREGYNGAYTTLGQDVIWSTPYTFKETDMEYVITHVEAVFQFNEDYAETAAGEVVYFNVRSGSVLEEDETMPETITTTIFDPENPLNYADEDLEFIIEESDIWNHADGFPYVWASFPLPSPILIEAGKVYQAEYRVPAAGSGMVYPPVTGGQEQYAGTLYDFNADGGPAWFSLGSNTINTRFRTQLTINVEDVTYESGVQLLQNYPNPAVDNTTIQFRLDEAMDITFEVYDMAGKLVYTEDKGYVPAGSVQIFDFNVSALSSGVYTYSIVSDDTRVTRKLTVK